MQDLNKEYKDSLQQIAGAIQGSDALARYLDAEEEEDYKLIIEEFEPSIAELHALIAIDHPLQLVNFEKVLLNPAFEGLYLPKVLGFSVIRGLVSSNTKYLRPQNHFREILVAIANSANFELIKKRIGQTIQIGFALSSDIWITDIINAIENKKVRQFLVTCKIDKYRDDAERKLAYHRYKLQFKAELYQTADFPATFGDLKTNFEDLFLFLQHRTASGLDNSSFTKEMEAFAANEAFFNTEEYVRFMTLYANFYDFDKTQFGKQFNEDRKLNPYFAQLYLKQLSQLMEQGIWIGKEHDTKVTSFLDYKIKDELTEYYELISQIHANNYINTETIDTIKKFYDAHNGLSIVNETLRCAIFSYFHKFISNLENRDYHEYFEISKIYEQYMHVFGNQSFNQKIKDVSMVYFNRCLVGFTDKRGKEYQEIKKFMQHRFVAFKFLKEKDAVEMFKTKRVAV